MKKVAIVGTHGTFKSTLTLKLAAELKAHRYTIKTIEEFAARCPYPINGQDIKAQEWIVSMQYIAELEAGAGHGGRTPPDFLICDRSILDAFVYTEDLCDKQKIAMPPWIPKMTDHLLPTYDFIFKTNLSTDGLVEDGTRDTDPKWQENIERRLAQALEERLVNHYTFPLIEGLSDDPSQRELYAMHQLQTEYMMSIIRSQDGKRED